MVHGQPLSVSIVIKILNTRSTGLFGENIVIASSPYKEAFGNSLRQYTKVCFHISCYSWCIADALIVVWSERLSVYIFRSSKPAACKGSVKCWTRVLISFKPLVEWSAIQNRGSSHIDEQNMSSLNEPSLFSTSVMKISMEVDLRDKVEVSDSWLRVASLENQFRFWCTPCFLAFSHDQF